MNFNFKNTYINLPNNFYSKISPIPVANPQLALFNQDLADQLGLEKNTSTGEIANYFSGNKIPFNAEPIALVYAGHQFGHFVPKLGDGRAILLGEIVDKSQQCYDIQLKGSGQTPYSRSGDGRAALGPMLREYILSEAMHALGVRTTRSLALVKTGELVSREKPLPGAILTRVASSHIRVGTFEYFAAQNDSKSLKILADYTIKRHYPQFLNSKNKYLSFLLSVAENQALLIANWMGLGFIHGVMNTDNMTISGETIDYGPCAFIDQYMPDKVFSSIDYYGRYAFGNQPNIGLWNLLQLGRTIEFLIESEEIDWKHILEQHFVKIYNESYQNKMFQKIGIFDLPKKEDFNLLQNLLNIMSEEKLDYTLTFRYLSEHPDSNNFIGKEFFHPTNLLQNWLQNWQPYLQSQKLSPKEIALKMQNLNPVIIPRNHQIQNAITSATENNNFSLALNLITALKNPYQEKPEFENLMHPPMIHEIVHQTFCGT